LQLSQYINSNAEKLRKQFVSHEGKEKLTVTTWAELDESQWYEFFTLMIKEIEAHTNPGVVDALKCDFSTTTRVENLLSIATTMDSFKQFFGYSRCIPCCGTLAIEP